MAQTANNITMIAHEFTPSPTLQNYIMATDEAFSGAKEHPEHLVLNSSISKYERLDMAMKVSDGDLMKKTLMAVMPFWYAVSTQ